jgi:hypothetical protein
VCVYILRDVLTTMMGAASGAGIVLYLSYLIEKRRLNDKNFKNLLSVQIALHGMLVTILQVFKDYKECKSQSLKDFTDELGLDLNTTKNMWKKYRVIQIRRFNQTNTNIDLNWNLRQFFRKSEGGDRKSMRLILTARGCYQHFNSVLAIRNDLLDKTLHSIEISKIKDSEIFKNERLIKEIGDKVYIELKSATDQYIKSMYSAIKSIYEAYMASEKYVENSFPNSHSYALQLSSELQDNLNEILNSTEDNDAPDASRPMLG